MCRPTICSSSRGIRGSTPRSIRVPGWQYAVSTISSIPTPGRSRGVSVSSSRERCPMKRPFVKISFGAGALLFGLLIVPQACTNLDETPLSLITPGNFFHTEPEVLAGLAGVYAQLRSTAPEGGLYDANEVSTDEIGVPIVTTTDIQLKARSTRRELFDFIESELIAARDSGLPDTWGAADNGRITKWAADAILANMYLNAGVFTKDGTAASPISATGY